MAVRVVRYSGGGPRFEAGRGLERTQVRSGPNEGKGHSLIRGLMGRILLILALVCQPVLTGASWQRADCGRELSAVATSCHESAPSACCCGAGRVERRGPSSQCPCLQRPEGQERPESPAPVQPTVTAPPHLLLCRVGATISVADGLPARLTCRGDSPTLPRTPAEARALLCIWLT